MKSLFRKCSCLFSRRLLLKSKSESTLNRYQVKSKSTILSNTVKKKVLSPISVTQPQDCRTCKKQPIGRTPIVKDCWYDVPYFWLEAPLRVLSLMAILLLLFIFIHLTVGQISTLKSFTTFLEHANQINDASQFGIFDKTGKMKEHGQYSPQDEKEDGDQPTSMESGQEEKRKEKNSKPIPLEIYKGFDDENAYFITFREECDGKQLSDGDRQSDSVTPPVKPSVYKTLHNQEPQISELYRMNNQPQMFVDDLGNVQAVDVGQRKSDADARFESDDTETDQKSNLVTLVESNLNKIGHSHLVMGSSKRLNPSPDIQQTKLNKYDDYSELRDGSYHNEPGKNRQIHLPRPNPSSAQRTVLAETKLIEPQVVDHNEAASDKSHNNPIFPSKPAPKLKFVMDEQPRSVEMKIDLNSVKGDDAVAINRRSANSKRLNHERINFEEETIDDMLSDNVDFVEGKINRGVSNGEEEVVERLENRPVLPPMEVSSDEEGMGNASVASLGRRPRAIEAIDKTISYSEHERTMKQEVEVTYKRAQDIARAVLKTSEAIANSLDLCRKPISTNFISDEPLTEAEDIIDQIVGQLKESLELTMGCRTCVKPHKDLMLFLRWLIFDDVSVKLCPSKPKAADLRKNYLLFNHDNTFVGRVCAPGESPRAPTNCTADGEAKPVEEGPLPQGVGSAPGKAVNKKTKAQVRPRVVRREAMEAN